MDVYVDLYFLINASMDLLCLAMTAAILHRAAKRWRLILSAVVGGATSAWRFFLRQLRSQRAAGAQDDCSEARARMRFFPPSSAV